MFQENWPQHGCFFTLSPRAEELNFAIAMQKSKTASLRSGLAWSLHADNTGFTSVQRSKSGSSSSSKSISLKGLPHIRSRFSSSFCVPECHIFLHQTSCSTLHMQKSCLCMAWRVVPLMEKHRYAEHSLNHWPGYLSVLLNQYINQFPAGT